jgi:hypothetical protein
MTTPANLIYSKHVQSHLAVGEQVRWAAQESQASFLSRLARNLGLPLIWLALSGFLMFFILSGRLKWEDTGSQKIAPFLLGGFLLVGLVLIFNNVRQFLRSGRVVYVVTDRAALIIDAEPQQRLEAQRIEPNGLQTIEVRLHRDGSGDLIFDRAVYYLTASKGRKRRGLMKVGFLGTPQAAEAYRWIQKIPGVSMQPVESVTGTQSPYEQVRVVEKAALKEREYILVITNAAICGANLSGSVRIGDPGGKQARWEREGRLSKYQQIDPLSQAFLEMDAENFCIQRGELQKITLREAYHTYRDDQRTSGKINLYLRDGSQRSFTLLGDRNIPQLAAHLRLLTTEIEVISKNPVI